MPENRIAYSISFTTPGGKRGLKPIVDVAKSAGISPDEIDLHGRFKAKIHLSLLNRLADRPNGKLILVTGITPTTKGEGKTTVSIGLSQSLRRLGYNVIACLREPSLGPVFGMKGGATGGGKARIHPHTDINLHFNGDFHAITSAHNLLSAVIDNHIHHGNKLGLDPRRITWRRAIDMNDRALTNIVTGLGGPRRGVPRESGFDITPASEIMAILCLSRDLDDLKRRLGRIVIGRTFSGESVAAADLNCRNAMALLLRDAIMPNLVQNDEGGPVIVHGGPFANIAHGCSSILGTRMGLKLADYTVTEAGFGADLGAEKFIDIKCRAGGFAPSLAVIVATVRALKRHGGVRASALEAENVNAVETGLKNLQKHVENMTTFKLKAVVAVNRFQTDTDGEIQAILDYCRGASIPATVANVFNQGAEGGIELAETVVDAIPSAEPEYRPLYGLDLPARKKIEAIATTVYGAREVVFASGVRGAIRRFRSAGYGDLPICVAKTQYSLSDNPRAAGRPEGFTITVREARLSAGAGFIVALTGDMLTMPGLPEIPSAEGMTLNSDGTVTGLL